MLCFIKRPHPNSIQQNLIIKISKNWHKSISLSSSRRVFKFWLIFTFYDQTSNSRWSFHHMISQQNQTVACSLWYSLCYTPVLKFYTIVMYMYTIIFQTMWHFASASGLKFSYNAHNKDNDWTFSLNEISISNTK